MFNFFKPIRYDYVESTYIFIIPKLGDNIKTLIAVGESEQSLKPLIKDKFSNDNSFTIKDLDKCLVQSIRFKLQYNETPRIVYYEVY